MVDILCKTTSFPSLTHCKSLKARLPLGRVLSLKREDMYEITRREKSSNPWAC